jgi:DNA replication factor GINS
MAETTLEYLKRRLDVEGQSPALHELPGDFYSRLSAYSQRLRRSAGSGNSEVTVRLVARQVQMIESMTRELLGMRTKKAMQQGALLQLLPEERYVCSAQKKYERRFEAFVKAVSSGQPSFVELAHRTESVRNVPIRFTKHVDELVGLDMKRYGPFEAEDVASIPAASAEVLINGGDAVEIFTREDA